MLTSLHLSNFRCFEDHTVILQPKTLLVGKNNAGKSTCVEALRLVSLVSERLPNLSLRTPPEWTGLPLRAKGVAPSLKGIDLHRSSLFHAYREPPAVVSATFANQSRLDVHIGPEFSMHAVVYDALGKPANGHQKIEAAAIPRVSILPQIGPLEEKELPLSGEYVRSNLQTARASLHFRNQLHRYGQSFEAFKKLVEESWPGLQLKQLMVPRLEAQDEPLALIVRDIGFSAEVASMGHGLQMWLQTIWFLARNSESSVLILDEPDVYMHADLQRRLVRMLLRDNRQFIIATHSPEMLAEVEPESVVVLDRSDSVSRSATDSKAVQELLQKVGSVHNLSLARLAMQRRILFVEGEDVSILKRFQNVIAQESERPIDIIPNSDLGGWSGWPAVLTLARFFRDNAKDAVEIYCVLDRDYHLDAEIIERQQEAQKLGVCLTIWDAKELENYIIVPAAIARLVEKKKGTAVSISEIEKQISVFIENRKDDAFDAFSEAHRQQNPKQGASGANKLARVYFDPRWRKNGGWDVVCGKDVISDVCGWVKSRYGVSISSSHIIAEMEVGEVHPQLATFLAKVAS